MLNLTLDGSILNEKNIRQTINEIKLLLPSIQYSINQKLKSFSSVSPNMLLFGKQMNDPIDNTVKLTDAIDELHKLQDSNQFHKSFDIIARIQKSLQLMRSIYQRDHNKQIYRMKLNYNKNKLSNIFNKGDKVLYYIGDRAHTSRKLRPRFSGPFIVDWVKGNTAQIRNEDTQETMVCHCKMLKRYNPEYFTPEYIFNRTIKQKNKLDKINRDLNREKRHEQRRKSQKKKEEKQKHTHKSQSHQPTHTHHSHSRKHKHKDHKSKKKNKQRAHRHTHKHHNNQQLSYH